uniref:C2H2-type domain-containing protein n=1 Tax=Strigamia maritima TaxID=126957 RepID=T1IPP3_STRMM
MDLFICGVCREQFNNINKFMDHKNEFPHSITCVECNSFFHLEEGFLEHKIIHEATTSISDNNIKDELQDEGQHFSEPIASEQEVVQFQVDGIFMCKLCGNLCLSDKEVCNHLKDVHEKTATPEIISENFSKLIPINASDDDITFQVEDNVVGITLSQSDDLPKKRRGRPRKSEQQPPSRPVEKKVITREKPVLDANGKYNCSRCTKIFNKERHYLVHRCWGANAENGDFVDLKAKELEESNMKDEDNDDSELEIDLDPTEDYKVYLSSSNGQGNNRKKKQTEEADHGVNTNLSLKQSDLSSSYDYEAKKNTIHAPSVPVFSDNEERIAFEEKVNSIDLSCVDYLFTTEVVHQELNELAPKISKEKNELEVFSCTICKKFFKTASNIRFHCLTHTDLKPFKCPRCSYSSNAKSNLYTHMRKHTGNLFKCSFCDFKNCNRSHMAEHEATHSNTRHVCRVCSNDYNTIKSLANHVRKYHSINKQGREYLATFMLKPNQNSLLHQCHICNRKFKKKLDRDRHLCVHNISPTKDVIRCEMCTFTTVRRVYLENHFRKHRIIYTCFDCEARFLSSVQLQEHLHSHISLAVADIKGGGEVTENAQIGSENSFSSLFESSMKSSWYLPEPDGVLSANKYTNIPSELVMSNNKENDAEKSLFHYENDPLKSGEHITVLDLLTSLNYQQMSMGIYNTIRETFGNEECRFCGRLFLSHADFEVHLRTHNADKPFKCTRCEYSSITKENLKRHTETVHDKRKFHCDQCDFTAASRTSIWHHQQTHRETPMECPECKKSFGNFRKLQSHIICAHSHITKKEISKIVGFNRRVQSRLGRRSYKCPYCDRVFLRSNTDLQKHIWIHEGVKPFKCSLCPHSCRSRNNLNVHMLRHSNDKPHICEDCGKAYKSKAALKCHKRSHSVLLAHSQSDQTDATDETRKRFLCEHCKFSTCSRNSMRAHYLRRHKTAGLNKTIETEEITKNIDESVGTKLYKCINCEFIFESLSDLKTHLK